MFAIGYVLSQFMQTIAVPIIKNKKGLVTDKDNYHPKNITNVVLNIVELILLECVQNELGTACWILRKS